MVTKSPREFEFTGALAEDLGRPDHKADPYPFYRWLQEQKPIYQGVFGDWIVTRYDETVRVLRDPLFSSDNMGHNENFQAIRPMLDAQPEIGPLLKLQEKAMLFMDPPDHTRLRGLVSKAFTPRTVEGLRGQIEALIEDLLDRQRARPSFDLVGDFAYQVPVLVICELLGVPPTDRGRFGAWSAALARGLDNLTVADAEFILHGNAAAAGLTAYFRELVAARRRTPGTDLLSALITAEEAGDRLTEDELLATCVLLFFAGHETTVNLIGNGTLALLRHPDQLQRLRQQPQLIANAVEELLRYDSPVQRTGRIAAEEVDFAGVHIQRGDRVTMLVGAANRDPAQFADPDRLDVTRPNASQHLSFAAGIHYCVGAPLARLEAQLAIAALLRRAPDLRLLDQQPPWRPTFVLRGLQSLQVAWS